MSIYLHIYVLLRNALRIVMQQILIEYLVWAKTNRQYTPSLCSYGVHIPVGETDTRQVNV